MLWSERDINFNLSTNALFLQNYCKQTTRDQLGTSPDVVTNARFLIKRLVTLMPHGAHNSPKFRERPLCTISKLSRNGGKFEGKTRVVVFLEAAQFFIGFRLTTGGSSLSDLSFEHLTEILQPADLVWEVRDGSLITPIPSLSSDDVPEGHLLADTQPIAMALRWLDETQLTQQNQDVYRAYLLERGASADEVITPRIARKIVRSGTLQTEDDDEEYEAEDDETEQQEMNMPLNTILYGPPGTGKTYATIEYALSILDRDYMATNRKDRDALKRRFAELEREHRIRFITFHQSFGYEDFVEGLRASVDEKTRQISYAVQPGVFKSLCSDASRDVVVDESLGVREGAQIWKVSIGSTGKADLRDYCLAHNEVRIGWGGLGDLAQKDLDDQTLDIGTNDRNTLRSFAHEMTEGDVLLCIRSNKEVAAIGVVTGDYRFEPEIPNEIKSVYKDFNNVRSVNWVATDLHLNILPLNDGKVFAAKTVYAIDRFDWLELSSKLKNDGVKLDDVVMDGERVSQPYVLIIDEINRGNVSRIFGELITLIEPSKRAGSSEVLETILPYSKKTFSVPNNVYLIGTMNTADRSLAGLDIALRRRFVFREMPPRPELLSSVLIGSLNVKELLEKINQRIEALLDRDHCIGHAYFLPLVGLTEGNALAKLSEIFRDQVIPLLQEYFFDDWQRIQWILNDHRKNNELYRFVIKQTSKGNALFGDDVAVSRSRDLWVINGDAFSELNSYLGILDHNLAS